MWAVICAYDGIKHFGKIWEKHVQIISPINMGCSSIVFSIPPPPWLLTLGWFLWGNRGEDSGFGTKYWTLSPPPYSTPNMHTLYYIWLFVSVNMWNCFPLGRKIWVVKITACFHNTLNSFISIDQGRFDSSWFEPFRKQNPPVSYSLLLSCSMIGHIRALLTICQCRPQMSQTVFAFDWQLFCCGACVTALCPNTHLWSEN